MKNWELVSLSLVFGTLVFSSCAPVYTCADDKPTKPVAGSNRLLAVVQERDELCDNIKSYEEMNENLLERNTNLVAINDSILGLNAKLLENQKKLKDEYKELENKHNRLRKDHVELQENYSKLLSDNFQRGHMFDERLKEQERRMQLMEDEANARIKLKEGELAERQKRIEELERIIAEQDSIANRLNRVLREALLGFKSDELTVEIKNGKVYVSMSDKLMFRSGSANVEKKGKEALEVLAQVLKQNEDFEILVEGHTDNVPIRTAQFSDNWDLSVARATSLVRILTNDYGLDPKRLTASGKGEFMPRASNESAEGRAQNRRTEIILSPKLDELMDMLQE